MNAVSCYERSTSVCICHKISDGMESKPILKGTRLQSISCRFVENYFAVQSIYDRVLNFDMQPHYQKQTHGSDVMDYKSVIEFL